MERASEHLKFVEWAGAKESHPHEHVCGDAWFVKRTESGVLFCAIDGLGHGKEAAEAAKAAIGAIADLKSDDPSRIISYCDEILRTTRGAALSLAILDVARACLSWAGIGNVEGLVYRSCGTHEWLPLRSGIVGCRLPSIKVSEVPVGAGDVLIMFSDGISSSFPGTMESSDSSEEMADKIITRQLRGTDDALVLVAKYHGGIEDE